jgi:hypothetical protein
VPEEETEALTHLIMSLVTFNIMILCSNRKRRIC